MKAAPQAPLGVEYAGVFFVKARYGGLLISKTGKDVFDNYFVSPFFENGFTGKDMFDRRSR